MRKIINMLLIILLVISASSCAQEEKVIKEIEVKEMRAIAELATVECYFHNVAKFDQNNNKTWFEFWKKENVRFWIEYEGVVIIGIKADEIKIKVDGENVTITLPKAEVLDVKVNETSLTDKSFIYDTNSQMPTAEMETAAFKEAQQRMKDEAEANNALLVNAEDNAKELLENYVKYIGDLIGIEYKIEWIEIETTDLNNQEA